MRLLPNEFLTPDDLRGILTHNLNINTMGLIPSHSFVDVLKFVPGTSTKEMPSTKDLLRGNEVNVGDRMTLQSSSVRPNEFHCDVRDRQTVIQESIGLPAFNTDIIEQSRPLDASAELWLPFIFSH